MMEPLNPTIVTVKQLEEHLLDYRVKCFAAFFNHYSEQATPVILADGTRFLSNLPNGDFYAHP